MARIDLPESKLKLRRRRMRRRLAVVGVLGLLLLAGLLAGLSHLPFLQIDTVQLSGNRTLASSTLTMFVEERLEGSYLYIFPKRNIFLYPKTEIRDALVSEHPLLSAAEVHAVDFHTIAVQVVEREPRALWCDSACYFMDETGAVYAPAPSFSSPVYVEYHGALAGERWPKQYLQPEQFLSLAALVDAIARELAAEQLDGVTVDRAGDVRMRFENTAPAGGQGFDVLFVLGGGEGDIFERFTLALKAEPFAGRSVSEFEYLDLRFGDKLYYKQRQ